MDIEIEGGRLQKRLMVDKRKLIVRQDLHYSPYVAADLVRIRNTVLYQQHSHFCNNFHNFIKLKN
jgi:hypothetical protein